MSSVRRRMMRVSRDLVRLQAARRDLFAQIYEPEFVGPRPDASTAAARHDDEHAAEMRRISELNHTLAGLCLREMRQERP
jgi:hypothetical protein